MFRTSVTVEKGIHGGDICQALFENYGDAKAFVEKEVAKWSNGFLFNRNEHIDGSFEEVWSDDFHELFLNDFAWATDFRCKGVRLYCNGDLQFDFKNENELHDFIIKSQEKWW